MASRLVILPCRTAEAMRIAHSPPQRARRRSAVSASKMITVLLCALLYLVGLASGRIAEPVLLTSDPNVLIDVKFDHIIVGGGLAGMVMANRLSEDTDKRVLLIEAGNDTRLDPLVRTVRLDNDARQIRWRSDEQRGGMRPLHSFGVGLGGSTSINGAKVDGPPASQIDALQKFGNPSWSWKETLAYMKKSQNYHPPGAVASAHGATYDPSGHGIQGPLDITFSPQSYTGFPQDTLIRALNDTLGIDKIIDAGAGEAIGFSFCPHFIKHGTNATRVTSATAYLSPIEFERSNLFVLTGWRGIRVNWQETGKDVAAVQQRTTDAKSNRVLPSPFQSWRPSVAWQKPFFGGSSADAQSKDQGMRAASVTVQDRPYGQTFEMSLAEHSGAQVTLSSGALITPLLLELSGIGDAKVLSNIGVRQRIHLPGVGRNLVDKPTNILSASTRGLHRAGDVSGDPLPAVAMLSASKVFGANVTEAERRLRAQLPTWARDIVRQGGAANVQGIMRQFDVTMHGIFHQDWPVVEWEYFSRNLIAIKTFVLQPFSRGYVHSLTNNSVWNTDGTDVTLNARLFTQSIDMDMQVASMRAARALMQDEPMRQLWQDELQPDNLATFGRRRSNANADADEDEDDDFDDWQAYILRTYDLICHNAGTAAMTSRDLGGVVDERFKVYGTQNLRVVDASVLPLQLSAHPSLTIFGVVEKAADIVRAAAKV